MRKKFSLFITLSILILAFDAIAVFAVGDGISEYDNIKIYLDNQLLESDASPTVQNERILVPFRPILEAFKATVEYDDNAQTIKTKKDNITLILQVGKTVAYVNGIEYMIDVPPMIINDRILVPLRVVSEFYGFSMNCVPSTQSVYITSYEDEVLLKPCFKIIDNSVQNTDIIEHTATVIICKYNNDILKDIKVTQEKFGAEELKSFNEVDEHCRIFVWDSLNGMKPLTQ